MLITLWDSDMTMLLFMFPHSIKTNKLLSGILIGNQIPLLELEFSFSFYKPKELVQPKWKCHVCFLPGQLSCVEPWVPWSSTTWPGTCSWSSSVELPSEGSQCLVLPLLGFQEGSSRYPSISQSSHFSMSLPPQESSVGRQLQPLPLGHIWVCHLPLPHLQLLRIHQELSLSVLLQPPNHNWDDAFYI